MFGRVLSLEEAQDSGSKPGVGRKMRQAELVKRKGSLPPSLWAEIYLLYNFCPFAVVVPFEIMPSKILSHNKLSINCIQRSCPLILFLCLLPLRLNVFHSFNYFWYGILAGGNEGGKKCVNKYSVHTSSKRRIFLLTCKPTFWHQTEHTLGVACHRQHSKPLPVRGSKKTGQNICAHIN